MVKMLNCYRREYLSTIANHSDSRFFLANLSPILLTALCLTTTYATNAQESPINTKPIPGLTPQSPAPTLPGALSSGNQISLNSRTLPGAWLQRPGTAGQVTTYLSDGVFKQLIGVDFLNSSNPASNQYSGFHPLQSRLVLVATLLGAYRYLDDY